ncbi:hypothetical protein RCL1_001748 [Eukaryota sp. TZLM3-RCL]
MKTLFFRLPYNTSFGQSVVVSGSVAELGDGVLTSAFKLNYKHPGFWEGSVNVSTTCEMLSYRYCVVSECSYKQEWGPSRELSLSSNADIVVCHDLWQEAPSLEDYLHECVALSRFSPWFPTRYDVIPDNHYSITFSVNFPPLSRLHQIILTGNIEQLGNWQPDSGTVLADVNSPSFSQTLLLPSNSREFEYKYVIVDSDGNVIIWEGGQNRVFSHDFSLEQIVDVNVRDGSFRLTNSKDYDCYSSSIDELLSKIDKDPSFLSDFIENSKPKESHYESTPCESDFSTLTMNDILSLDQFRLAVSHFPRIFVKSLSESFRKANFHFSEQALSSFFDFLLSCKTFVICRFFDRMLSLLKTSIIWEDNQISISDLIATITETLDVRSLILAQPSDVLLLLNSSVNVQQDQSIIRRKWVFFLTSTDTGTTFMDLLKSFASFAHNMNNFDNPEEFLLEKSGDHSVDVDDFFIREIQ